MTFSCLGNNVPPFSYPQNPDEINPNFFSVEYYEKKGKNAPLIPCIGLSTEEINGLSKNLFLKINTPKDFKTKITLKCPCEDSPFILFPGILKRKISQSNASIKYNALLKKNTEHYFTLTLAKDYKLKKTNPLSIFKIKNKNEKDDIFRFEILPFGHNFTCRHKKNIRNPYKPLVKVKSENSKIKLETQQPLFTTKCDSCSVSPSIDFSDPTSDKILYEILENW
jgi:hypothetical protein